MITSLWFISENIAGYLGSSLGGLTFDTMGFEMSTLVVMGMQVLGLLIVALLSCGPKLSAIRSGVKDTETQGLLKMHQGDKNANYQSLVLV